MSVCLNCFNEDCLEGMRKLESNSVDLLVTDPPYGYSFMGKDWDKAVPSVEIWRECLRVLKAGCFAFVMSAPRSDVQCEMILKLKEAGFDVGFTPIYWAYASGFPKAMNISKMVDKKLVGELKVVGKRTDGRYAYNFQDGNNQFVNSELNTKKEVNSKIGLITEPKSIEAIALNGFFGGFQPKPAVEVVLVVMKPIEEKTFVEQALKNGHGGTWLGRCRIPYSNEQVPRMNVPYIMKADNNFGGGHDGRTGQVVCSHDENCSGRFPANLLVSDNVLDNGEITKSVMSKRGGARNNGVDCNYGIFSSNGVTNYKCGFDDVGGFSRYFSLDAWWEKAVQELPEEQQKTFPFLIVPKASKSEKNKGLESFETKLVNDGRNILPDNAFQRGKTKRLNIHPTVKPLKLMQYLITLGSNKGEIVLDPFMGSGTTLIAAKITNRKGIGFELSEEYFKIALARIKSLEQQKELV